MVFFKHFSKSDINCVTPWHNPSLCPYHNSKGFSLCKCGSMMYLYYLYSPLEKQEIFINAPWVTMSSSWQKSSSFFSDFIAIAVPDVLVNPPQLLFHPERWKNAPETKSHYSLIQSKVLFSFYSFSPLSACPIRRERFHFTSCTPRPGWTPRTPFPCWPHLSGLPSSPRPKWRGGHQSRPCSCLDLLK